MPQRSRPAVDFPFQSETGCALGRITWSGPYVRSPGQPVRLVDDVHFVYVTRGVCDFDEPAGIRRLGAGDMMVLTPGQRYGYRAPPGEEWDEHYIRCDGPIVNLWLASGLLPVNETVWKLLPVEYWADRMVQVLGEVSAPDPDESLGQLGRLQTFLADMRLASRSSNAYPDDRAWLRQARELLEARDPATRPDIRAAADAMGCGYHTFRRRFTKLSGIGPAKYRLQSQVNLARYLIRRYGHFGNKELAASCGFADEFHFSKQFKTITGISPTDYRKQFEPRPHV